MAEKRMFSNKITQSDAFLNMPATAQNLYFHLNMDADDDGFVNRPKSIMRMVGASEGDMDYLIQRSFLIPFQVTKSMDVVVVIKHWFIHNTIRSDRKKLTSYVDLKNNLILNENGSYTLLNSEFDHDGRQLVGEGQHRLDKIRLEESSIEVLGQEKTLTETSGSKFFYAYSSKDSQHPFNIFWSKYPRRVKKQDSLKRFKTMVKDFETLNAILLDIEDRFAKRIWNTKDIHFIPHPTTYLNGRMWEDELIEFNNQNKTNNFVRNEINMPNYTQETEDDPEELARLRDEFRKSIEKGKRI